MATAYEGRRRDNGRDEFRQHTGEVLNDFQDLRRDISKLAAAVGKIAQSRLHTATDDFQHLRDDLGERAQHGADEVSGRVREKPLASLGASLGVGVILGLALATLNRR